VPCAYARDFASAIRTSEIEIVPGASHTPHFTDPDAVLDRIERFLEKYRTVPERD